MSCVFFSARRHFLQMPYCTDKIQSYPLNYHRMHSKPLLRMAIDLGHFRMVYCVDAQCFSVSLKRTDTQKSEVKSGKTIIIVQCAFIFFVFEKYIIRNILGGEWRFFLWGNLCYVAMIFLSQGRGRWFLDPHEIPKCRSFILIFDSVWLSMRYGKTY